jgi:hypothetical protein
VASGTAQHATHAATPSATTEDRRRRSAVTTSNRTSL